ncbi:MAG: hypothetical protein K1X75_08690 [Leptospirales bacterium]|nr:hypothetical protein [Leptospirales bacterium]
MKNSCEFSREFAIADGDAMNFDYRSVRPKTPRMGFWVAFKQPTIPCCKARLAGFAENLPDFGGCGVVV